MFDIEKILFDIEKVVKDIKSIKIQGATNIALEAFKVLKNSIDNGNFENKIQFEDFLYDGINRLSDARPTEPMLFNGMKYVKYVYGNNLFKTFDELKKIIIDSFDYVIDLVNEGDNIRSNYGSEIINDGDIILTHCHSGSVIKVLKKAHKDGKKIKVYNTETRPLFQGRKTSNDLLDAGIDVTMITDDMAPYFIDDHLNDTPKIDKVFLGCDAIKLNGNIINKIGSFGIGLSSWYNKVPVYVVGSLMKIDVDEKINIELRDGKEIWKDAPENLKIQNYAFDTLLADFIEGIVSRYGIIKTNEIKSIVEKNYSWMF